MSGGHFEARSYTIGSGNNDNTVASQHSMYCYYVLLPNTMYCYYICYLRAVHKMAHSYQHN